MVTYLKCSNSIEIKKEAMHIINTVSLLRSPEYTYAIVTAGALPALIELLRSPEQSLLELVLLLDL